MPVRGTAQQGRGHGALPQQKLQGAGTVRRVQKKSLFAFRLTVFT